jgi:competence protein ComEC
LGTAAQLFQPVLWPAWAYGAVVLVVFCWRAVLACGPPRLLQTLLAQNAPRLSTPAQSHHGHAFKLMVTMLLVGSIAFASVAWRALWFQSQALSPALEGVALRISGVVAAMPQWHTDGLRFRFEVQNATRLSDAQPVDLPAHIQLAWYNHIGGGERKVLPDVKAGERWQFTVRLKRPHGLANPGGFDAELWLWEQGLQASGHVRDGPNDMPAQRFENTWRFPIEQLRQSTRERIAHTVSESRWAGLIGALLMGDQAAIERADWDVFRITGIAHLMSISGLHITLWAWVARWLVLHLWRVSGLWGRSWCLYLPAPWAALWGGLLCAAAYAVFSGWGVPAQRTVVMLAVACVLRFQALRWPLLAQWLLAMVAVLCLDPWALMQAGFWLSFVAVGVLFLSAPSTLDAKPTASRWHKLHRQAVHLLQEQMHISVCLAPLSMLLFQQLSVVGLLVNLFAIPWVTLVVTPLAFLGALWSPVWQLCSLSLQALCAVLQPLSSWSWAVWQAAQPPWWLAAVGLVGGAWVALAKPWRQRMGGLALVVPCLLWPAARPVHGQFELLAADVGQGNAVLVRTALHSLLFDTGPRFGSDTDAGQRVLLPLLQRSKERLDTLVLSHQDSDHAGGALSVQQLQPQVRVLTSISQAHALFGQWPMQRCEAGQGWQWDGVQFEVLHPLAGDYEQLLSPNARSCVLRISAGQQVALLTADIEAFQEQALLQREGAQLRADVLLVPHHGSKTSSTEAFIEAVQPRWALFQMGYRNRYGHPAPQVLRRYAQRGVGVRLSPDCGAMTWRSDQPDVLLCERAQHRRYWRQSVSHE